MKHRILNISSIDQHINADAQAHDEAKPNKEARANNEGKSRSSKRTIASEALFAGERELMIQHASDHYHLRITSQGKLILTK